MLYILFSLSSQSFVAAEKKKLSRQLAEVLHYSKSRVSSDFTMLTVLPVVYNSFLKFSMYSVQLIAKLCHRREK